MRIEQAGIPLVLMSLAACASSTTGGRAHSETCKPEAARTLVGMAAPDDTEILRRTGGTIVRRIAPGDPTTRDYRVERVTVTIADGRVVAASCG